MLFHKNPPIPREEVLSQIELFLILCLFCVHYASWLNALINLDKIKERFTTNTVS